MVDNTRKYLKLPIIGKIFENKEIAYTQVLSYIERNVIHFHDGETITIRFKNVYGEIVSSLVVININSNNEITLSFSLSDSETVKIVETNEEPTDTNTLWLSEDEEETEQEVITGLQDRIRSLESTINKLTALIDKHEYALTHTISGGDFLTNSVKYDLENSTKTEKPAAARYGETYDVINTGVTNFDLYIGESSLHDFLKSNLYTQTYYYLKPKFYNSEEKLINPTKVNYSLETSDANVVETRFIEASQRWYLYGLKKGNAIITCKVVNEDETEIVDDFILNFKEESEANKYEPNVKHVLIKTAETFDILSANTKYLLLNEFVWCKDNNTLYFKGESSDGSINLFQINGTGGGSDPIVPDVPIDPEEPDIPDTPDTPDNPDTPSTGTTGTTNITINNGILEISDSRENKAIFVDENGELIISKDIAYVDDEGILRFGSSSNSGKNIIIVNNNDTIEMTDESSDKTLYVNDKNELVLPNDVANIDENGILNINNKINNNVSQNIIVSNNNGTIEITDDSNIKTLYVNNDGELVLPNDVANIDENDVLNIKNKISNGVNIFIETEQDVLQLTDIANEKTMFVNTNDELILPTDIAEIHDDILNIHDMKPKEGEEVNIKMNNEKSILEISDGYNYAVVNDILTLVGSINETGELILNNTVEKPSANITEGFIEMSNITLENGYLTLTNVQIDEEGYIIIT